jgi:DNA-binding transcriptional ArsR family regulator
MSVIQTLINDHRLVKVTAADFNGTDWDGRPLEPTNPKSTAENLSWAMNSKIQAQSRAGSDYAYFGVKDENTGDVTWAGPGDYLFDTRRQYNRVVVMPGVLIEELLKPQPELSLEALAEVEGKFVLGRKGPHNFIYGQKMLSEGAIRTLMELAKGPGTPQELTRRTGMTQGTVVDGLTALRGAGMCTEGQTPFMRIITATGKALLASNPSVLPG